jgi:hypothetical protein
MVDAQDEVQTVLKKVGRELIMEVIGVLLLVIIVVGVFFRIPTVDIPPFILVLLPQMLVKRVLQLLYDMMLLFALLLEELVDKVSNLLIIIMVDGVTWRGTPLLLLLVFLITPFVYLLIFLVVFSEIVHKMAINNHFLVFLIVSIS